MRSGIISGTKVRWKNGGPTKTIALKKGSAAIGHAHKPSAPNRDQRGRKRDNNPDTGAFERGAARQYGHA